MPAIRWLRISYWAGVKHVWFHRSIDMGHRCMHLVLDKLGTLPSTVTAGTRATTNTDLQSRG